jgi:hypothetical protein
MDGHGGMGIVGKGIHILLSREEGSKPASAIFMKVSLCPAAS